MEGPGRVFVARERELARLHEFLDGALAGGASICFVTGEAGYGKTTLLDEFVARAQVANGDLLVGDGDCNAQTGIGDPYLPFREVLALLTGDVEGKLEQGAITAENANRLREFVRVSGQAIVESGPDLLGIFIPGGQLLARLGAKLSKKAAWAERLHEIVEQELQGADGSGEGLEQRHIYEQYTNVLRAMARERPLVLVLDDLQWADTASIGLLFHLARRIRESRILIVGAYRRDDVALGRGGERHPLESVLNELKRYFGDIWIDLGHETENGGRRVIDGLVDTEPNRLGEGFRQALYRHTEGHPLFTIELLRSMQERGDLQQDEQGRWVTGPRLDWDALPPRVEGVIEERISRLEDEPREMLAVASVEGESFTAEVIASIRRSEARGVIRQLSGELEKQHRLISAQGVHRLGSQRLSSYRFRHNLFQKYVYGSLDDVERSYMHEDVGRVLEGLYGDRSDEIAVQLARHFELAGEARKAIRYLLRAGEAARRAYANTEAIEHFQRALSLIESDSHGVLDPGEERDLTARLQEGLGDVLELTGMHQAARSAYGEALRMVPESDRLARSRLYRRTGKTWHGSQDDRALHAFASAETALGARPAEEDPEWWVEWIQVQLDRMWALYVSARTDELVELTQRMRPPLDRFGTSAQRAVFLQGLVMVELRRERYRLSERTVAVSREYLAASEGAGNPHQVAIARFQFAFALLWHGRVDEAEAELRQVLDFTERSGDARYQVLSLTYLTFVHRLRGDVPGTREFAERAREVAAATDMDLYVHTAACNLAWVAAREGNWAEARQLAEAAVRGWGELPVPFPWTSYPLWTLVAAHLREEDLGAAIEHLRAMSNPIHQPLPDDLAAAVERVLASWDAGERQDAGDLLRTATALATSQGYV